MHAKQPYQCKSAVSQYVQWFTMIMFLFAAANIHAQIDSAKVTGDSAKTKSHFAKSGGYIYNELNAPRHMKLPTPKLPDSDGDGVPDQFDLEPNTPPGVAVDSHGRAIDTDGDGVPDYRDKEKLTPQRCFPVDSNGVGTCPEPACCKEMRDSLEGGIIGPKPTCNIGSLPPIQFKKGSVEIDGKAKKRLDSIVQLLNESPTCKLKVIGYAYSSYLSSQECWDRVTEVIEYFKDEGIDAGRLIFIYGDGGEPLQVDLQTTMDDGPHAVPSPHPSLSKLKQRE